MLFVAACTSSSTPPSCADAVAHYYAVNCDFTDGSGNVYSEMQFASVCQQAAGEAPADCIGKLDDWLSCLDSVSGGTNAGCDCSTEQMTLLECN
jgi:hypothetical protein